MYVPQSLPVYEEQPIVLYKKYNGQMTVAQPVWYLVISGHEMSGKQGFFSGEGLIFRTALWINLLAKIDNLSYV